MVTVKSVQDEITIFLLMKEFGGTPGGWRSQTTKDIKFVTTILSTYNRIKNAEMNRANKERKRVRSRAASKGHNPLLGKRYMRVEKPGPNGLEITDTPI